MNNGNLQLPRSNITCLAAPYHLFIMPVNIKPCHPFCIIINIIVGITITINIGVNKVCKCTCANPRGRRQNSAHCSWLGCTVFDGCPASQRSSVTHQRAVCYRTIRCISVTFKTYSGRPRDAWHNSQARFRQVKILRNSCLFWGDVCSHCAGLGHATGLVLSETQSQQTVQQERTQAADVSGLKTKTERK